MVGLETADRAWRSQERDFIDSDLESAYEDRQNGGLEVDLDDEPGDDEFCLSCGELLDDGGDGSSGERRHGASSGGGRAVPTVTLTTEFERPSREGAAESGPAGE